MSYCDIGKSAKDEDDPCPVMETTLLVKHEAFVYKIPAQANTAQGWKATGWNLDKPDWTGRLKVIGQGKDCYIKLEEKASGKLYAKCPVEAYPGPAVQTVSDRYVRTAAILGF